jgi:hypothetical protein
MEHLVIGATDAAYIREYVRSWELATSSRPLVLGWQELCAKPLLLSGLRPGRLFVRLCLPTADEIAALIVLGGGAALSEAGDVERLPLSLSGMDQAMASLEGLFTAYGVMPIYATHPKTLSLLLRRDVQRRYLERDGVPTVPGLPIGLPAGRSASSSSSGGTLAHDAYESFRGRLRHKPGQRAVVRLSRSLGETPTVVAWMGGRGIRAQANCRFTPAGAARDALHPIEDEAELRPLLGRLFEMGATVEEDFAGAEIEGRSFVLTLLAAGNRVVLADVGPGGPFRRRGEAPEPGVPRDVAQIRQQVPADVYEKIEETCVRLCRIHRLAALGVDVGLSRRFDRFVVLELDPFGDMPSGLHDATGWSGTDHLVRRLREMAPGK